MSFAARLRLPVTTDEEYRGFVALTCLLGPFGD